MIAEAWSGDERVSPIGAKATPSDVRDFAKRECERLQKLITQQQQKLDEWKAIADL